MKKLKKITKKQINKLNKRNYKEALLEWKRKVHERDNFTCRICNKDLTACPHNRHSHHIIPRQFKEYSTDINNGITLCFPCHKVGKFSPHMNALWFDYWLYTNNIEQWNYIHKIVKKLKELKS